MPEPSDLTAAIRDYLVADYGDERVRKVLNLHYQGVPLRYYFEPDSVVFYTEMETFEVPTRYVAKDFIDLLGIKSFAEE